VTGDGSLSYILVTGDKSMVILISGINVPKKKISKFCKEHSIKSLSVFGSALNDRFNENSDIDLLVQFEEDKKPSLFELIEMERSLSEVFNGRKIDLRTCENLSR
jgi:predicted nucleotidyltransferase